MVFDQGDYVARPREIGIGDFILVSGFSGGPSREAIELARKDAVGVGDISKLMGALRVRDVWQYRSSDEKKSY